MKVRELLSSKDKWTRHACFRDAKGTIVHDPAAAHSYCLVGAIMKCYNKPDTIFRKIKTRIGDSFPSHWNDRSSYEDVITLVTELDI